MFYPMLLKPVYKEMVWGGQRLRDRYQRTPPYEKTGESWDVTCRPNEMSVIENGPDAGMTLADCIAHDRIGMLGTRTAASAQFPLLVKIIDAQDNLSVQVHPSDGYLPGETGKNEMWYIMEAPDDGALIIGLKDGVTRSVLQEACARHAVEKHLYRLSVRQGDVVDIPAGLVHALTSGVMVAEIQQNADITYRLYDYGRMGLDGKPRQLHPDESLAAIDFSGALPKRAVRGLSINKGANRLAYAAANPYFAAIIYEINEPLTESALPDTFTLFTCVSGQLRLSANGQTALLPASRSAFVPAAVPAYTLDGKGTLIKSFVPVTERDFIAPLLSHGCTLPAIHEHAALRGEALPSR